MGNLSKFIIHTNVIEALDGGAAVLFTFLILGTQPLPLPIVLVMFSTFFLYTLNRLSDIAEDKINYIERVLFFREHGKEILLLSASLFIISALVSLLNSVISFVLIILPFLLVYAYSFFRLKKIFFVKNLLVALGWSTIPLFVTTYLGTFSLYSVSICSVIIFSVVLINTIVFDIKDQKGDEVYSIKTIVNTFGTGFMKKICYVLDAIFFVVLVFFLAQGTMSLKFILLLLMPFYIVFYVAKINKKNVFFISEYVANLDILILLGLSSLSLLL